MIRILGYSYCLEYTPCDAGEYPCRKGCGRRFKSSDTRRNHEMICKGAQAALEELQIENTSLQAQLTDQEEASNQHMAVASQASVSAVKAVCDIMSKPHKEFDASKLVVHQPEGKRLPSTGRALASVDISSTSRRALTSL